MNTQEQKQIIATILEYPLEIFQATFVLGDIFTKVWDKKAHRDITEEIQKAKKEGIRADYAYLLRNAPKSLHKEIKSIKGHHEDPSILKDRCTELRNFFTKNDRANHHLQLVKLDEEPLSEEEYQEKRKKINRIVTSKYTPNNTSTAVDNMLSKFADRQLNQGLSGIPTGFKEFDKLTLGLATGTVHIFGARPSVGKTALAGQIMLNAAKEDIPVLFISHEMTEEQILKRCCCNLSMTSLHTNNMGKNNTKSEQRFYQAGYEFKELPITIYDETTINLQDLGDYCLFHSNTNKRKKQRGLFIVDYIQLERIPNYKGTRTDELSEICAFWKYIARETDYAVLWLAQLGRPAKGKEKETAKISDLRDCGGLEQDAHSATIISRKGHFCNDLPANVMELDLQKNRDGCVGHTNLEFIGWCQRVQDISDSFQPLSRDAFTKTADNEANLQNKNITDKPKQAKKEVQKVPVPKNVKDTETF